jgi:cytidine deaminase
LYYAKAKYPETPVDTIAIFARSEAFDLELPVTPCGACRQVMAETENTQQLKLKVLMIHQGGRIWKTEGMANLMPFMFMPEKLKRQ